MWLFPLCHASANGFGEPTFVVPSHATPLILEIRKMILLVNFRLFCGVLQFGNPEVASPTSEFLGSSQPLAAKACSEFPHF